MLAFTVVWLVPTLILFVTSFRSPENIFDSGWWTVLADLFDVDQYTFENYMQVITKQGMGCSFVNSFTLVWNHFQKESMCSCRVNLPL